MQDTKLQTFVNSRILLGWLDQNEGPLWLAGRENSKVTNEFIQASQKCIQAVTNRPKISRIDNPLSHIPTELKNYAKEFWEQQDTDAFKSEQWEIVMADLTKVCGVQANVSIQQAKERFADKDLKNIYDLASITLPKPKQVDLPINFDHSKNAWIISSPNPNLRVSGSFTVQIPQGGTGLAFGVSLSNSFLQVAECNGRFILRDGYHRAIGLLNEGVTTVPVLTKKFNTYTEMNMPIGLLPQELVFGNNPPYLMDYLNDEVSMLTQTPVVQKIIVVQALELTTFG